MIRQLSAPELKQRLDNKTENLVVLDVREPWERAICALPGTTAIPMREIPARLTELPRQSEIVVMCHHGVRSQNVAAFLEQQGFTQLSNLAGGIAAWAREVDPKMPTY